MNGNREPLDYLKHQFVDMSHHGIGPHRVCNRCGARDVPDTNPSCQPQRSFHQLGVMSEYDPNDAA